MTEATRTPATRKKAAKKRPQPATIDAFTLLIKATLGVTVVKELKFHPTRRWRFDYAIPGHRIAIEKEGGVHTGGRHTRPAGFLGDMEKYNAAALLGWFVLRVTPKTIMTNATIEMIREAINPVKEFAE